MSMSLKSGNYVIANGMETTSYLTFPDKAGNVTMGSRESDLRTVIKVTEDETGFEFEVDAIGSRLPLGLYGPRIAENGVLRADFDSRTLFRVDPANNGIRNSYIICTLSGSAHNLVLEPITSTVQFQTADEPIAKGQTWIFTKV